MPLVLASFSIVAPDAGSRLTIMRTFTPSFSIDCAMVCILTLSPCAFWMSQLRLSALHWATRAGWSALAHRAEDWVSGRMIPTLAPLPSMAPPPPDEAGGAGVLLAAGVLLPPAGGGGVPGFFFFLGLQAVMASSAALSAAIESVVLRMRRYAFPLWRSPRIGWIRPQPNLFAGTL